MAARKLTVVIAQAPGKNPNKRQLEEDIAAQLMIEGVADVSLVPHLNDLASDDSGALWLRSIRGDVVVLAWLYPRAADWILDRMGIKGREGTVLLRSADEDEDADEDESAEEQPNGIGALNVPNRSIFAIDLRTESKPDVYLSEIRGISRETSVELISLGGLEINPATTSLPIVTVPTSPAPTSHITNDTRRRWYPVIDYSRCTNCM